jgi:PAS domain S-box-containing protein
MTKAKTRAYIVEDEALIAMEISDRLLRLGYEVCGRSAHGEKALEEIPSARPDLVLMDIKLAGKLNGIETATRLRSLLEVPVVFLSAFSDQSLIEGALDTGSFGYLVKPFEERELHATLQAALHKAQVERLLRSDKDRLEAAIQERTAELYESEARLRSLGDNLPSGAIYQTLETPDGRRRFTYVSQGFELIAHVSITRLMQDYNEFFTAIHPDDRDQVARQIGESNDTLTNFEIEARLLLDDGQIRWVHARVAPRRLPNGDIFRDGILLDVTEQKAMEVRLRDRETMLSSINTNLAGSAICRLLLCPDGRLKCSYVSPNIKELVGVEPHDFLGDPGRIFSLALPADLPAIQIAHRYALATGGETSFAFRIPHPDGGVHCLHYRGRLVERLADGTQVRDGVATDITIIKEAEAEVRRLNANLERLVVERTQALRHSEEQLRYALNATSDGLWDWNIKTGAVYFSPQWLRLLGYAPEEASQRVEFFFTILHPEDVERTKQVLENHLAGRTATKEIEVRLRTKSGEYLWVRDRGKVVVRDEASKPVRMVGTITDITGRMRAELQLRESEQRLDRVVKHIHDALIVDDAAGRVLYANQKFFQLFGIPESELPAVILEEYVAPEWRERLRKRHDRRLRGESVPEQFEYEGMRRDGTRLWLEVSVVKLFENGQITGTQSVIRDITERKRIETQLLRTQRMQSIGRLAAGVAHDVNNALSSVLMRVTLLRMDRPDADSENLEMIEVGARRAADMARQLLIFAKGADGQRMSVRPQLLLSDLRKMLAGSLPRTINLQFLEAVKLQTISGDPTQLHQVLLNLCVNARDAMPDGGNLTVEAKDVEIDAIQAAAGTGAKPGPHVLFRVTDTGTGIPPEVQERMFEPFFTTKAPDKGTGLGLSTVLGIVKSHGGFIQLRSTPGQGSSFEVYIPGSGDLETDSTTPLPTSTQFHGDGETILIVDDDPAVRSSLQTFLTRLGFRIITAADGAAALVELTKKNQSLRVVITDQDMPQMSGIALVRALKRLTMKIDIIVASGRIEEKDTISFRESGVHYVLEKPLDLQKLVAALKAILQK